MGTICGTMRNTVWSKSKNDLNLSKYTTVGKTDDTKCSIIHKYTEDELDAKKVNYLKISS